MRESALRGPAGWFSLPVAAVQTGALTVLSDTLPPPSLKDSVARIAPRPLLLIYAGRGGGGEELNVDFYRAAGRPKAIWRIPRAGHVGVQQPRAFRFPFRRSPMRNRNARPPEGVDRVRCVLDRLSPPAASGRVADVDVSVELEKALLEPASPS